MVMLAIASAAAYTYKVNVSSSLNLRNGPSASAEVVAQLHNGDIVESDVNAEEMRAGDEWLPVSHKGKTGFVKAQYLKAAQSEDTQASAGITSQRWYNSLIDILKNSDGGYGWMAYVICALTWLMWAECKFFRRLRTDLSCPDSDIDISRWALINSCGLILTCGMILFYVLNMGVHSFWFFTDNFQYLPSAKAIFAIIANFIFLVYVSINLTVFFIRTIFDIAGSGDAHVSLSFGLYSWLIGLCAATICTVLSLDMTWLIIAELACQSIQFAIIVWQVASKGNFLTGLAAGMLYVVCSVIIAMLVLCVLLVMVWVLIAATVFYIVIKLKNTPAGFDSDTPQMSGDANIGKSCYYDAETSSGFVIRDQNNNPIYLKHSYDDIFTEEHGSCKYRQKDDGTFENLGV